jgi:hypothetical protein
MQMDGTQFRGIEIFHTDSDRKHTFLDNLIGLYEYKSWLDGKIWYHLGMEITIKYTYLFFTTSIYNDFLDAILIF